MKITPTVGRIVHYIPTDGEFHEGPIEPHAAVVVKVNADDNVNLAIFDQGGSVHAKQNVSLVQDGDLGGPGSCQWMPYQIGQAAKTEQLQKQIPPVDPNALVGGE